VLSTDSLMPDEISSVVAGYSRLLFYFYKREILAVEFGKVDTWKRSSS